MSRLFLAALLAASLVVAGCGSGSVVARRGSVSEAAVGTPAPGGLVSPHVFRYQLSSQGRTCFVGSGPSGCSLIPCQEFVAPDISPGLVLSKPVPGSRACRFQPAPPARVRGQGLIGHLVPTPSPPPK